MSVSIKEYYKRKVEDSYILCHNIMDTLMFQVGKTVEKKTVDIKQLDIIVDSIINNLDLKCNDIVIDIGCGNGLLTKKISKNIKKIYGFDICEELIEVAKKHNYSSNIEYVYSDIFDVDLKNKYQANKLYMYEVLQHFGYSELRKLLLKLKREVCEFELYIGGIPDYESLFKFYSTKDKRKYFYYSILESGTFHIGTWWYKEHIIFVCEDLNLKVRLIKQNKKLYTSKYRFDVIISSK